MNVITIGRSSDNDVVLSDPYVGRHHCQIVQHDGGRFSVVDLNSRNGTFINGQRIQGEMYLDENDFVRIGNTTIPWRRYFSDDKVVSDGEIETPEEPLSPDEDEESDVGSKIVWRVIGIVISLVMIVGGLSGLLVLRGTNSGIALTVVGIILLVIDVIGLIRIKNKE